MAKIIDILKVVEIYFGEDRIILQPWYTYGKPWSGKNGIKCKNRIAGFQILAICHSTPVNEILTFLDQMFENCLDDVPEPTEQDRKARIQLLLLATGEKTWHAITRSYANIGVTEIGQERGFRPGIPEKGSFLGHQKDWSCNFSNREQMEAAFKDAAAVAIEAQNLHNPPPLG
jgi:hypothetical protein